MDPLQFLVPLDTLEAASSVILYGLLLLAIVNMGTRMRAHERYVEQAEEGGADAIGRYVPHVLASFLLVLFAFAYMVIEPHGGFVVSMFVIGTLLADFFEFESRKVEARNGLEIEKPKSAVVGSVLVVTYAAYQSLFFVVAPVWNAVV